MQIPDKMTRVYAWLGVCLGVALWQIASFFAPDLLLPSPWAVSIALLDDVDLIAMHLGSTLGVALNGLFFGTLAGMMIALLMHRVAWCAPLFSPMLWFSQSVPMIAIAPIIIIWFGAGLFAKSYVVALSVFFPITTALYDGLLAVDKDAKNWLTSLGADDFARYRYLLIPSVIPHFFIGLKLATTYAIGSAVVAEWLGGNVGLGVYLLRVKKAFMVDKLFAGVLVMALITLLMMKILGLIEQKVRRV